MIIGYFAQSYGCNIREQLLQELPELALRMMKLAKANSRRFVNAQLRKAKNQQILVNAENSLTEKQQILEKLNKDIADLQAEIEAFNQQKVIASKNLQTNTKQPFISDTKQNHKQINVENQSSVITHLTGKEFGEFEETREGLKQLREIAINYLIKLMKDGESVYCKAVNSDVSFDTTGIKKIKSFSSNRIKLKSLFAIKELIKNATLVTADKISYDVEERKRGVTYDVIKSPIIVDGIEYGVRMVLRKLPTGKYQYDVQIRDNINVIFDSFVQAIKNDEGRSADKSDVLHRCNYNYTKKNNYNQALFDKFVNQTATNYVLNLFIFDADGNEISDIADEEQKIIDSPESIYQELSDTQSIKNHNQDDLAYLSSYL